MEYASESQQQLEFLKELFEQDKLKAVIDKTFPFEEVVDTIHGSRKKKGKLVVFRSK